MTGKLAKRPAGVPSRWDESRRGLLSDLESLMGHMWGGSEESWFPSGGSPSLDVSETDTAIEVKIDIPGVKSDEIDIQLNGNSLTVSGEHKEEKEEKGKTYHRVERRSGSFSRTLPLPCPVEEDEVVAEYNDGVLTITLPKTEEAKTHKIKIKG